MAITPPKIGSTVLPHASAYREFRGWRGGNVLLVNGAINFDLVTIVAKRTFSITWMGLTTAQKNDINDAFDSLSSGGMFTPPADETVSEVNVTWSDQQQELEWEATSAGAGRMLLLVRP